MSQQLQIFARLGGGLPVVDSVNDPMGFSQGIPLDAGNVISIDLVSAIHHYHQGLPYTANSRLAAGLDDAVTRMGSGGTPFTAAGRIAFGSAIVEYYSAGIPYTALGQIANTEGVIPEPDLSATVDLRDWFEHPDSPTWDGNNPDGARP